MNIRQGLLALILSFTTTTNAMSASLAGKRVLITGAGRGIGRAMALICSQEGCQVAVSARTASELQETASMGENISVFPCDVTNSDQVESMVQKVVKDLGGIDILINNAGGAQTKGPAESLNADDLLSLLDLNVVSVHRVTSSVLRNSMQKEGQIVNISSRAGKMAIPNMSFYVASKFALEGYSATLAVELQDRNVRVNTLSPGMVDTQSFPKAAGKAGVRSAESVRDGLMQLLSGDATGHYLHVDELDQARAKGLPASTALKPINEPKFNP